MPRHRDSRRHRIESTWHPVAGETAAGAPVALGHGTTMTISERYCAGCAAWFRVAGVFGALAWDMEHNEHGTR